MFQDCEDIPSRVLHLFQGINVFHKRFWCVPKTLSRRVMWIFLPLFSNCPLSQGRGGKWGWGRALFYIWMLASASVIDCLTPLELSRKVNHRHLSLLITQLACSLAIVLLVRKESNSECVWLEEHWEILLHLICSKDNWCGQFFVFLSQIIFSLQALLITEVVHYCPYMGLTGWWI